jgi:hypothetical protein
MDDEVAAILDANVDGEETTQLWTDLAKWAFAQPDIPSSDEMRLAIAKALLDKATAEVDGLQTAEQWASAARYFQAENFHGLTRPACIRAIKLRLRPPA